MWITSLLISCLLHVLILVLLLPFRFELKKPKEHVYIFFEKKMPVAVNPIKPLSEPMPIIPSILDVAPPLPLPITPIIQQVKQKPLKPQKRQEVTKKMIPPKSPKKTTKKIETVTEKPDNSKSIDSDEINTIENPALNGDKQTKGERPTSNSQRAVSQHAIAPVLQTIVTRFGAYGGPSFAKQVTPKYPLMAKKLNREGIILLRLTIDAQGRLISVEVVKDAGFGMAQAAIEAVQRSTFIAAKIDGKAVKSKAILPIKFRLQ
ncbi:MAG: energy transducer TonB [Candidatus Magnetoovum sp. WYHC-5]|nr:energy transducer TonB [Candidatus Magnetoovum sp. WYHC-5]